MKRFRRVKHSKLAHWCVRQARRTHASKQDVEALELALSKLARTKFFDAKTIDLIRVGQPFKRAWSKAERLKRFKTKLSKVFDDAMKKTLGRFRTPAWEVIAVEQTEEEKAAGIFRCDVLIHNKGVGQFLNSRLFDGDRCSNDVLGQFTPQA